MMMLTCSLRYALLVVMSFTCVYSQAEAKEPGSQGKIRVLLAVGGHGFEPEPFYDIFRAMPDVEWTKIELPKEADRLKPGLERDFDVIVRYDLTKFSPAQEKAFVELLQKGIGFVSLHHNVCAHADWPEYRKMIGGKYIFAPTTIDGTTYQPTQFANDQSVKVQVVDQEHPITRGIDDFQITDEVYGRYWIGPHVHVLLKTDHPKSQPQLAWVTHYGSSPVFYLMLGHDHNAYQNLNYRKLIHQGIQWAAAEAAKERANAAQDPFAGAIFRLKDAKTGRISSWDRNGGNADCVPLRPGDTKELANIEGPGVITHLYYTVTAIEHSRLLRSSVLRIYWDDETTPSVEVPLGDFFCNGDGKIRLFASHFIVANHGSGSVGYNAYFPMPFRKRARIVLWSSPASEAPYNFYYHIEYERYNRELPADTAYFHAQFRCQNPTRVKREGPGAVPADKVNQPIWDGHNLTGAENYVILEAKGTGHLVGLFLTCNNLAGGWWGEGDDMIFIDGDKWPPTYHGTGTEEIFGGGASPNREYTGPYTGFVAIQEQGATTWRGQNSMYRWFVHDPIRFQKSVRWTIEHGHANNFENDYSSVAYWYQTEPHKPFPPLPELKPSGAK
jgi:type 1 glutamine amidotransferase